MALRSRVRLSLGSKILALKYKERLRLAGKRLTKRLLLAVKVLLMTETPMTTKKLIHEAIFMSAFLGPLPSLPHLLAPPPPSLFILALDSIFAPPPPSCTNPINFVQYFRRKMNFYCCNLCILL